MSLTTTITKDITENGEYTILPSRYTPVDNYKIRVNVKNTVDPTNQSYTLAAYGLRNELDEDLPDFSEWSPGVVDKIEQTIYPGQDIFILRKVSDEDAWELRKYNYISAVTTSTVTVTIDCSLFGTWYFYITEHESRTRYHHYHLKYHTWLADQQIPGVSFSDDLIFTYTWYITSTPITYGRLGFAHDSLSNEVLYPDDFKVEPQIIEKEVIKEVEVVKEVRYIPILNYMGATNDVATVMNFSTHFEYVASAKTISTDSDGYWYYIRYAVSSKTLYVGLVTGFAYEMRVSASTGADRYWVCPVRGSYLDILFIGICADAMFGSDSEDCFRVVACTTTGLQYIFTVYGNWCQMFRSLPNFPS